MPLTRTQARDEMLNRVKAAFASLDPVVVAPENIVWENSAAGQKPAETEEPPPAWARVTLQHASGGQASLTGALGTKLYDRRGLLTIQLFTRYDGLITADAAAESIEDFFINNASDSEVEYFNVVSQEVGEEGPWFQTNIVIDFEYRQVR